MIVINFKSYEQTTGAHALSLAKIANNVSIDTGVRIILCVESFDLRDIKRMVDVEVYTQHIDQYDSGAKTGYVTAFAARKAGADGTLLNHSEHKLDWNTLVLSTSKAKEEGLGVILCAETIAFAQKELELFPNEIALELPELISGNISITKANPSIIKEAVHVIGSDKLLVGSGIRTADDIKASIDLGAKGVILASGYDLSNDPEKYIYNLAKAFY